jgi:hypothetical protein
MHRLCPANCPANRSTGVFKQFILWQLAFRLCVCRCGVSVMLLQALLRSRGCVAIVVWLLQTVQWSVADKYFHHRSDHGIPSLGHRVRGLATAFMAYGPSPDCPCD